MSTRFRYEPKTPLQKLALRLKHPRKWRAKITPCVFDNESGHRFQLTCDEEEVIRKINFSCRVTGMARTSCDTGRRGEGNPVAQAGLRVRLDANFKSRSSSAEPLG